MRMIRGGLSSVLWLAVLLFVVTGCSSGGGSSGGMVGGSSGAVPVRLVAANDPGPDPFTSSIVSMDEEAALRFAQERLSRGGDGVTEADAGVVITAASGGDGGLYGVSDVGVCDREMLMDLLEEDPDRAAGWAEAAGVDLGGVEAFVASLAPAVVGADVVVTNHGWHGGSVTSFVSVLQGGTAVLVDDRGRPRVQCACGNPLAEAAVAELSAVDFEGDTWDGFDPAGLVMVTPTQDELAGLVVVDIDTGEERTEAVGGELLDGILLYGPEGIAVLDEDDEVTLVVEASVGMADDDGRGGVVFTTGDGLSRSENPVTVIWHLEAGAHDPVPLVEVSDGADEWLRLVGFVDHSDRWLLLFERWSDPGRADAPDGMVSDRVRGDLMGYDFDTGEVHAIAEATSGWEHGMFSPISDGEVLQWLGSGEGMYWTGAVGPDFEPFEPSPWDPFVQLADSYMCNEPEILCPKLLHHLGNDELLTAADRGDEVVVARVTDDWSNEVWATSHRFEVALWGARVSVASGQALIAEPVVESAGRTTPRSLLIDLDTGAEIRRYETPGTAILLRVPLRRPRATDQPSDATEPPSTTQDDEPDRPELPSPEELRSAVRNAPVPELCMHPPGRLVDGELPPESRRVDEYGTDTGTVALRTDLGIEAIDLTGDEVPEVVAVIACSAGGVPWPDSVHVWTAELEHLVELQFSEVYDPGGGHRETVQALQVEDEHVVVEWRTHAPGDAMCCGSLVVRGVFALESGRLELLDVETLES